MTPDDERALAKQIEALPLDAWGEPVLTAAEESEAAVLGQKLERGRLGRDELCDLLLRVGRRVTSELEARQPLD